MYSSNYKECVYHEDMFHIRDRSWVKQPTRTQLPTCNPNNNKNSDDYIVANSSDPQEFHSGHLVHVFKTQLEILSWCKKNKLSEGELMNGQQCYSTCE